MTATSLSIRMMTHPPNQWCITNIISKHFVPQRFCLNAFDQDDFARRKAMIDSLYLSLSIIYVRCSWFVIFSFVTTLAYMLGSRVSQQYPVDGIFTAKSAVQRTAWEGRVIQVTCRRLKGLTRKTGNRIPPWTRRPTSDQAEIRRAGPVSQTHRSSGGIGGRTGGCGDLKSRLGPQSWVCSSGPQSHERYRFHSKKRKNTIL